MSITSIAGATYLNGLTPTVSYSRNHDWLTWASGNIWIAKTPSQSDGYNRIFWTGQGDGNLWCKGTFGTRIINQPIPTKVGSVTGTDLYSSSGVTAVWSAAGCATQNLTLVTINSTPTGFQAIFNFVAQTDTVATAPTPSISVTIPGIGTPLTAPNGLRYDQTTTDDSGNSITWASIEFTSVTPLGGTFTSNGTTVVWDATQFTVAWDMHYQFSDEFCYYLMTYVDDLGVEGPPSPISDEFHRTPSLRVVVSGLSVSTDINTRKKRLYRSAAGTNTGAFYFLDEIDNATTSYTDMKNDSNLSEKFTEYYNPPANLEGLIGLPNGILCAFKDRDVWFSDQYIPTSWNPENVTTVNYPIKALAASGNDCIVLTTGRPSIISGDAPDNMTQAELMIDQSCVASRGVARVGNTVLYPSNDGLVSITGGSSELVTKQYYKREDWQALSPSSMVATSHDGRYHAFNGTQGLVIDLGAPEGGLLITTNDEYCQCLYSDEEYDLLYLAQGNTIVSYDTSATPKTYTWKSKEFQFERPVNPSSVRIIAANFTNTYMNFYAEGSLVHTQSFYDFLSMRIPFLRQERVWSFEIVAQDPIDAIEIATSMGDLAK